MRSVWLIAGCLSLVACGGRAPSTTGGETESGEGSSGASSSSTDTKPSETQAPTDEGPEGGEPGPCEQDQDCGPGMLCIQSACQTDCGHADIILEVPPMMVGWVVDRSLSMATTSWDHDDDPGTASLSRWAQARLLIDDLVGGIEAPQLYSLALYPSDNACNDTPDCFDTSACSLDGSLALEFGDDPDTAASSIMGVLPPADSSPGTLRGGSPARYALEQMADEMAAAQARGEFGNLIVLVTDGGTNCEELSCDSPQNCPMLSQLDSQLVDAVQSLTSGPDYFQVLVVGIGAVDGSDSGVNADSQIADVFDHLNALSIAGGVPKTGGSESFWTPADTDDLTYFLNGGGASGDGGCSFDLSEAPNSPPPDSQIDGVEVYLDYGDTLLPHLQDVSIEDCESQELEGWVWAEPGVTFVACKTSCDQIQANYGLEMRVIYPCE